MLREFRIRQAIHRYTSCICSAMANIENVCQANRPRKIIHSCKRNFQPPNAQPGRLYGYLSPHCWARRRTCTRLWQPSAKFRSTPKNLPDHRILGGPLPMLERILYRGWSNAYRLSNGTVELIVLADVGREL